MKKFFIFLTAISLTLVGCQSGDNNDNATNIGQNDNGITNVNVKSDDKKKKLSATQIAERLVKVASSDADVRDATAIVAGKYAIVGIDVDKDIDRSKVGTIKFTVTEALQKDPYGANAVVTADADIVTRLKGMAKEIKNGKPIIGVMEELAAIIGRIIPEVPDESHKTHPEPTEENESKLSESQDDQLDETQNDQANDMLDDRKQSDGNGEESTDEKQEQNEQDEEKTKQGEQEDLTEEEIEEGQ